MVVVRMMGNGQCLLFLGMGWQSIGTGVGSVEEFFNLRHVDVVAEHHNGIARFNLRSA